MLVWGSCVTSWGNVSFCGMLLGVYLLDRHRVNQSASHSVGCWLVNWLFGSLVILSYLVKKRECSVSLSQECFSAIRVGRTGTIPGSSSKWFDLHLLIIILPLLHTHTKTHARAHTHTHTHTHLSHPILIFAIPPGSILIISSFLTSGTAISYRHLGGYSLRILRFTFSGTGARSFEIKFWSYIQERKSHISVGHFHLWRWVLYVLFENSVPPSVRTKTATTALQKSETSHNTIKLLNNNENTNLILFLKFWQLLFSHIAENIVVDGRLLYEWRNVLKWRF